MLREVDEPENPRTLSIKIDMDKSNSDKSLESLTSWWNGMTTTYKVVAGSVLVMVIILIIVVIIMLLRNKKSNVQIVAKPSDVTFF